MSVIIGILEGDYIGPEITREAVKVLKQVTDHARLDVDLRYLEISGEAYDKYGTPLPDHTLEAAERCDALLKGPFGGPAEEVHHPKWSGIEQKTVLRLRKHFNLFTNLRPVRVIPGLEYLSPLKSRHIQGVDMVIVRELLGGIYFGPKKEETIEGERVYADTEIYRESEIRRIAIRAFDYARRRNRKMTLVAKSNILTSSILWRDVIDEVASDYPDVETDYLHIDNASMQLILDARSFDIILTSNLMGDILSDEAAVLVGSIGLLPSASLGDGTFGLYEPIHGSAPSIANQDLANPISSILCVALMLRYTFEEEALARAVEQAVESVLEEGYRTIDLMQDQDDPSKQLGTTAFGNKVTEHLQTYLKPTH